MTQAVFLKFVYIISAVTLLDSSSWRVSRMRAGSEFPGANFSAYHNEINYFWLRDTNGRDHQQTLKINGNEELEMHHWRNISRNRIRNEGIRNICDIQDIKWTKISRRT